MIKAFLKDLKMKFESQINTFPLNVVEGIEESIAQHASSQTISLKEFKKKHLSK